jgi:hypothetical protein
LIYRILCDEPASTSSDNALVVDTRGPHRNGIIRAGSCDHSELVLDERLSDLIRQALDGR